MIDYIWRVNNLDVYYSNETNGGGDYFAIEYMDVVREWYADVDHALEWCSGPGFIGYSLLASGLCKNVSFNDMYSPAIEMLQRTKHHSKFDNNINIFEGNTLDCVPKDLKFDLVIGNPPHWKDAQSASFDLGLDATEHKHVLDILVDLDWTSHMQFFKSIKHLLSANGKVLLQENAKGSTPKEFEDMINIAGLKINFTAESKMYKDIYYIEVGHK